MAIEFHGVGCFGFTINLKVTKNDKKTTLVDSFPLDKYLTGGGIYGLHNRRRSVRMEASIPFDSKPVTFVNQSIQIKGMHFMLPESTNQVIALVIG